MNIPKQDMERTGALMQRLKRNTLFESSTADQQLEDVFAPGPEVSYEDNQLLRSAVSGSLLGDTAVPGD